MNIKIGEYARLNSTLYNTVVILKTMEVFDNTILTENDGSIFQGEYGKDEIINHSYNIIDLIEVGDYVNEQLVMEIYEKNSIYKGSSNYKFKERTLELFNTDYECIPHEFLINNKRIESILTKEQFSSMEYKVRNSNEKN